MRQAEGSLVRGDLLGIIYVCEWRCECTRERASSVEGLREMAGALVG